MPVVLNRQGLAFYPAHGGGQQFLKLGIVPAGVQSAAHEEQNAAATPDKIEQRPAAALRQVAHGRQQHQPVSRGIGVQFFYDVIRRNFLQVKQRRRRVGIPQARLQGAGHEKTFFLEHRLAGAGFDTQRSQWRRHLDDLITRVIQSELVVRMQARFDAMPAGRQAGQRRGHIRGRMGGQHHRRRTAQLAVNDPIQFPISSRSDPKNWRRSPGAALFPRPPTQGPSRPGLVCWLRRTGRF